MKNISLIAVITALLISANAIAQIDSKGNVLLGGNFKASMRFKNNSSANDYDIAFSPRLGYYFFKGLAAGFDVNGQFTK